MALIKGLKIMTDPYKYLFSKLQLKLEDLPKIVKLLRQFPRELESKEHVDLLLTLHGINKRA